VDQSRSIVIGAAAISLAASLFAIGAAVSSDDDGGSADPSATTEVAATEPAGTAGADTTTASGVTDASAGERVDIAIAGFRFNDGEPVTVSVGTEVMWTNEDGMDHSIEFDEATGIPPSPDLAQGATYSFTFSEPGTYEYICGIHPRMTGTIVVEA
jgi:plastocyanin